MESILDMAKGAFADDAVEKLSSVLHETPNATKRGLQNAVPASLAGLAAHASSEHKAEELLGTIRGGDYPHLDADEIPAMISDPRATEQMAQSGQGFLSRFLGGRTGNVVDAIAGQSGLSRTSASTLLGIAAPFVMQQVGKAAKAGRLDARGLSSFLASQGKTAAKLLPTSLTSALGVQPPVEGAVYTGTSKFNEARGRIEHTIDDAQARARDRIGRLTHREHHAGDDLRGPAHPWRGLAWLLAGFAALALLGVALFRPKPPEPVSGNVPRPSLPDVPRPQMPEVPKPEMPDMRKPEAPRVGAPGMANPEAPGMEAQRPGTEQQPGATGANEPAEAKPGEAEHTGPGPGAPSPQVVGVVQTLSPTTGARTLEAFLAGSETAPRRFVIRGVTFPSSSSETMAASGVLNATADALNAHPNAKVLIEGYTDETGPTTTNEPLSQARADAVKNYLVARGVSADRIQTVGRGSERPIDPGNTPAARATNRRVELVVTP